MNRDNNLFLSYVRDTLFLYTFDIITNIYLGKSNTIKNSRGKDKEKRAT